MLKPSHPQCANFPTFSAMLSQMAALMQEISQEIRVRQQESMIAVTQS